MAGPGDTGDGDGKVVDLVVEGNITDAKAEGSGTGGDERLVERNDANAGDEGILPAGEIDPVFEAKARVLNHAVCI